MGARPGLPRSFFRGLFFAWLVICCLGLAFSLVRAAVAAADPVPYKAPAEVYSQPVIDPELHDCPEGPDPIDSAAEEEYSDEILELRAGRLTASQICLALADRSDLVAERLWWAVVELAEARPQRALTNEKLQQLLDEGCEGPCPVNITADSLSEAQTAELVDSIDSSGEASKVALWFLVGVVVTSFVAVALRRTVDRGV